VLLRRELYITPALLGASVFVVLQQIGAPLTAAWLAGFAVAFATRAGAIIFHWQLPAFPGRAPPGES